LTFSNRKARQEKKRKGHKGKTKTKILIFIKLQDFAIFAIFAGT
jgi:hypothetical protein